MNITEIVKTYMVLGDAASKLEAFVWIFNCFKFRNLVSVRPKSIKLGQIPNLNVIFHVMMSIDLIHDGRHVN